MSKDFFVWHENRTESNQDVSGQCFLCIQCTFTFLGFFSVKTSDDDSVFTPPISLFDLTPVGRGGYQKKMKKGLGENI